MKTKEDVLAQYAGQKVMMVHFIDGVNEGDKEFLLVQRDEGRRRILLTDEYVLENDEWKTVDKDGEWGCSMEEQYETWNIPGFDDGITVVECVIIDKMP